MGIIKRMIGQAVIQNISNQAFEAGQNGENPPVLVVKTESAQEYIDTIIDKAYKRGRKSILNKSLSRIGRRLLE